MIQITRIVIPKGFCQTCNQLIQISHWIPVAIECNVPLYFPDFKRYSSLFEGTNQRTTHYPITAPKLSKTEATLAKFYSWAEDLKIKGLHSLLNKIPNIVVPQPQPNRVVKRTNPFDTIHSVNGLGKTSLWALGWNFRNTAAVEKHREKIKAFFSPMQTTKDAVNRLIDVKTSELLIGIHMRRGDYRKYMDGVYFYDDATIKSWMQQITQKAKPRRVQFLLVSNEPIKIQQSANTIIGANIAIQDLYALSKCDAIIGPPSTFSAWAAFYGNVPYFEIISKSDIEWEKILSAML